MASEIQNATGIATYQLGNFRSCSIATEMSWAADRQTTREEDRAYSLLGLFDVNMPLIYGEGNRAFLRLQKEPIQDRNDESIPASSSDDVLGRSPENFRDAQNIVPGPVDSLRKTFSISNVGVALNVELLLDIHKTKWMRGRRYVIKLNCWEQYPGLESTASPIVLVLLAVDATLDIFARESPKISTWRSMQEQTGVSPSNLKSLGRKEIFIAYRVARESTNFELSDTVLHFGERLITRAVHMTGREEESAIKSTIWCVYEWNSRTQAFPDWLDIVDAKSSVIEEASTHDKGISKCYWIQFSHSNLCEESAWLIVLSDLWLPRFGLWTDELGTSKEELSGTIALTPEHLYPTRGTLSCRKGALDVSIMPLPPAELGSRWGQYRVTFRLVAAHSYTGAVGQHVWVTGPWSIMPDWFDPSRTVATNKIGNDNSDI